jgi:cytoskeletal protein CcmA (bactofilin family)
VKAREVVLFGSIHGNVEATERIVIHKDAQLIGDIRTARIIIEEGAYFKGSIDLIRPTPKAIRRLAEIGSPEAEAADWRAEEDIAYGRYTTIAHNQSVTDVLTKELDKKRMEEEVQRSKRY